MLTDAEIAARYVKIRPYLDERQRRLWLGVEAQPLGSGGVAVIARATGADVKTVRRGTAEIESGADPGGRVRGPGGGRPGLAELDAGLVPALEALVDPATRGDPMSPRWTTKSTANLAAELTRQGHQVTARTVASLGYYGKLTPDRGIKVGKHTTGHEVDAGRPRPGPSAATLARIEDYVVRWLPGAAPVAAAVDTCLYTSPPDGEFVLRRDGPVVMCSPCSGHGFKFTPAIGRLTAALAIGEIAAVDAATRPVPDLFW